MPASDELAIMLNSERNTHLLCMRLRSALYQLTEWILTRHDVILCKSCTPQTSDPLSGCAFALEVHDPVSSLLHLTEAVAECLFCDVWLYFEEIQ